MTTPTPERAAVREAETLREEVGRLRAGINHTREIRQQLEREWSATNNPLTPPLSAPTQPTTDDVERASEWSTRSAVFQAIALWEKSTNSSVSQQRWNGIHLALDAALIAARAQGRAEMRDIVAAARKVLAQYQPHEIVDAEAELRDALISLPTPTGQGDTSQ